MLNHVWNKLEAQLKIPCTIIQAGLLLLVILLHISEKEEGRGKGKAEGSPMTCIPQVLAERPVGPSALGG